MHVTVFMGASIDGFVARLDGTVDFLDAAGPPESDMGFGELISSIDVLLMGRNTFDFVVDAVAGEDGPAWPYGDLPIRVATTRPLELSDELARTTAAVSGSPAELIEHLSGEGFTKVYVDGGKLGADFFSAGLVDRLTITTVPVLIGEGIRVFGPLEADQLMSHVATSSDPSGLVQTTWTRP